MVPGVLKLYGIVTGLSVLAFFYCIVDSFGGLMYSPNNHYILELEHHTQRQRQSSLRNNPWGPPLTRNIGS